MANTSIQDIDEQLLELERILGRAGRHPFDSLVARRQMRPRFEKLAKDNLFLAKATKDDPTASFRVLEVMEMIRARDIAAHFIRTTGSGPSVRSPWPEQWSATINLKADCDNADYRGAIGICQ